MSEERCRIPKSKLVSVSKISRKWSLSDSLLNDYIEKYHINIYSKIEERIELDKNTNKEISYSYCSKFTGKFFEEYGTIDKKNSYFLIDDIQECEKILPHLTCPIPEKTLDDLEAEHGEYIPAKAVIKWLKMSPLQFIDMMNAGQGPRTEYEGFLSPDVFERSGYDACYFNIYDLEEWQEKHSAGQGACEKAALSPTPSPIGGQAEELAQVRAQLAEITKKWEQATARADFLDRERARNRREIDRLQDELAKMREAQDQGGDAEQAGATRKELEATKAKLQDALEGHGLLSEVLKRKIEGEPWDTTKAWLQSLGLSGSNIGLFLREKVLGDEGYRAAARNGKPKK